MSKEKTPGFDEQLASVQEIVAALESEDIKLADSLKLFEQGMKLIGTAQHMLSVAEQRINALGETNIEDDGNEDG